MATDHNFRIKNGLTVGAVEVIDSSGKLTANAFGTNSNEKIEDVVADMITGSTHSNITVTYNDTNGTLAFAAAAQYGDSDVEDYLDGGTSTPVFSTINSGAITSTGDFSTTGSITSTDGSGTFEISGDSNSNTYLKATGEIRVRPSGTSVNKLVIGSNGNITTVGTISSGAITSSGASSGRYTGLEVVNTTNAGGTETAIGLGVVAAGNNACDVKLVANRVGANSGSDFYIEQTDSSGSQQETFRITESGNATFAGSIDGTKISVDSGSSLGLRLHTNSGITASNNYMNFFTSQTNGWSFNANGTGADSGSVFTISSTGAITATTVNTGQGANELYAMNQNVRTTDSPTFGGLTLNGGVQFNGYNANGVNQINGAGSTGWLDFNMDTDSVYPQSTTDNQTVLGSVTHMNFVGDSNGNGTGGRFYWGYGVDGSDSGTFTETMALDRSGNLTLSGTVDGRDVATDGTKLDTISTNADVTPSWVPSSDPSYATQSYVGTQISNLVDSAPGSLDTLNELAAALGDDANFSTTVTNSIATKVPLAGGTMTGTLNMNSNNIQNARLSGASTYLPGHAYSLTHDGSNVYWHIGSNSDSTNHVLNLRIYNSSNNYVVNTWSTTGLSVAGTITATGGNSGNWNTAYGWGNHASAGYLTSSSTQSKYLRSDANDTATGRVTFDGIVDLNSTVNFDANGQQIVLDTDGARRIFDFNRNGSLRMSLRSLSSQDGFNFDFTSGSNLQINGNRILTTADEGPNNGLDADTVDGVHASGFLRTDGSNTGTFIDLYRDVDSSVGAYIDFREGSAQDIRLGVNVFDSELPQAGTALVLDRINSGGGDGHLVVHGEIFAGHGGTPANGNKVWHEGNDGAGSGLHADLLDGFEREHFTNAEDAKLWTGISASATQAKRYHIARLYGCPAHWDSNWQNIEFIVTAETYESAFLKFRLMGDYGGAGSQANMIKLYLQDAQGPLVNNFRFVLGSPVDAGWDHSGQDTFYVDLYAEVKSYAQYEIHAKTYGHATQSSNPTSGGATTVFYGSPTTTNISDFSVNHIDPTFRGYKIWHAGNDGANSTLDADKLDGQEGSYYLSANGGDITGQLQITTGSIGENTSTTTKGLVFDGNYTNGQYRHRFRKEDKGGGVPLYLDYAAGTANSYTPIVRFGPWSNNTHNLEVFGQMRATSNIEIGVYNTTASGTLILNGTTANKQAALYCTNGNLHIDSNSGNGVYLNWSNGSHVGTYFGNGSSGQVAHISNAGLLTLSGTINAQGSAGSTFYAMQLSRSSSGTTTPDIWGTNNTLVLGTSSSDDRLAITTSGAKVTGNIEHDGLTMTSGTDVDQLYTAAKSLTVTKSWADTGIIFNNLTTGSYIVQLHVNNHSVGGQNYNEYYTGTMSWYSSGTNSTETDEIVLHRAGHAPNAGVIFLRTARVTGNTSPNLHLEIKSNLTTTGNSTYTFKFRRLI